MSSGISNVPDKIESGYGSPEISMVGFNWGWEYPYNKNDEWYTLTGNWIKDYGGEYNWNINRLMVYVTSINFD